MKRDLPELKIGQTVKIHYDAEFKSEYPHTYRMYHNAVGTVINMEYVDGFGSMVEVATQQRLAHTMVERRYLVSDTSSSRRAGS